MTLSLSLLLFIPILFISLVSPSNSAVTTFRVYNEPQILERLENAPIISTTIRRRNGQLTPEPIQPSESGIEQKKKKTKRRRIRTKIVRKLRKPTSTTTTEVVPVDDYYEDESKEDHPNPNTDPVINIQPEEEIYQRLRRKNQRQSPKLIHPKESPDLQRAESGNPFINSTAPISTDFSGDGGGLQFQIQILHPLLNSDSLLGQKEHKIPQNKTVPITHSLSDDIEIPLTPDLKKLPKKELLWSSDSLISIPGKASKVSGEIHKSSRKPSTPPKPKQDNMDVTVIKPYVQVPSPTSYPPITSQTVAGNLPPSTSTTTTTITTTVRPTIKLTNPPVRISSTTRPTTRSTTRLTTIQTIATTHASTTQPTTPITTPPLKHYSTTSFTTPPIQLTSPSPSYATTTLSAPGLIIFPPEDEPTIFYPEQSRKQPLSQEEEILKELLSISQQNPPPSPSAPQPTTNFFDLLNLFTTSATTTTIKPTPPTTTPTPKIKKPTEKPKSQEQEVENALQLALLESLLGPQNKGNQNSINNQQDLNSLLQLVGGINPEPRTTPPTPPTTQSSSLQAALNNMLSVLSNPFSQLGSTQQSNSLNNNVGSLFGGGSGGLFGGSRNSIFNLNPGASDTRTTVIQRPSTPKPTASEAEFLSQLLNLGIPVEPQNTGGTKSSPNPNGNWANPNHDKGLRQPPTSDTMQLLNILLNNNFNPTTTARPNGPYWWLDMNAFMGGTPTSDPTAGIRPKLGHRDYFIKVR